MTNKSKMWLSLALALLCGLVVAGRGGLSSRAAETAQQLSLGEKRTVTTNSQGYATVPHALGIIPESIILTPVASPLQWSVDQVSATSYRVRFARSSSSSGALTFAPYVGNITFYVHFDYTPAAIPTPTPTPHPTPGEPLSGFPHANNTGVPSGWTPTQTLTSDYRVTTNNAVVENIRLVNASLLIDADNVTVRNVEIQGGVIINDPQGVCRTGLLIENVSLIRAPGQVTTDTDFPAIGTGGYTARRVRIDGLAEGFRVSGKSIGCGVTVIEDSFARVQAPDICHDWHGDALQGYDGQALTLRNSTFELGETSTCGGTAAFFVPSGQGNTSVNIDHLLVKGGSYPFRLGVPGSISGLKIVNNSWFYAPVDVNCAALTDWNAEIVEIDQNYQVTSVVRAQPCLGSGS